MAAKGPAGSDAGDVVGEHLVALGEAIARAEHEAGLSGRALAEKVPMDDGHLSRIKKGQIPGLAISVVLRIERALGLKTGELFASAGIVPTAGTTRDVIQSAAELRPSDREPVLDAYDAALRRTSKARSMRRSSK